MLRSIGKISKSLLLKVFVGIIILPFLFWGMGDVFRGGSQNVVAYIENEKISTQEFVNYLERLNLNEENRKNLSETDMMERILGEYVGKKIMMMEIQNLNINISDSSLREFIINDKTFQKNGKFSRIKYEEFLISSGLDAPSFESNIVEQEKKRQFLNFLSSGLTIPHTFVQSEFNKENQNKEIKFIDLNEKVLKKDVSKTSIENFYQENKNIFTEKVKNFIFTEIKPETLTGQNEYNELYFKTLDKIENEILDGRNLNDIAQDYKLKLNKIENAKKLLEDDKKSGELDKELYQKIFQINEVNKPELISFKNRYYVVAVSSIKSNQLSMSDPKIYNTIKRQFEFRNKIEQLQKLSKKIETTKFVENDMIEYAKTNQLNLKSLKIMNDKKNLFFKDDVLKKIFSIKDGRVEVVSNRTLTQNYLVFSKKTSYNKISKSSPDYEKYKQKAKSNFAREIFRVYDSSLNSKYKVKFNKKTIDRLKNSF